MRYKLDKLDRRILEILDENARTSLTQIAHLLGISKQLVSFRLKRLEGRKIIDQYSAYLDRSKLGYYHYQLYLKLAKDFASKSLIKILCKVPSIHWVAQASGTYNLIVYFLVKNLEECYLTYNAIIKIFSGLIQKKELLLTSRAHYFNQRSITYAQKKLSTLQQPTKIFKLKPRDYALINAIKENARIEIKQLAKQVDLSEYTTRQRLNYLIKIKIIREFKPRINYQTLGYTHYQISIYSNKLSSLEKRQLFKKIIISKESLRVTEVIGKWDLNCDVVLPSGKNPSQWLRKLVGKKLLESLISTDILELRKVPAVNTVVYS